MSKLSSKPKYNKRVIMQKSLYPNLSPLVSKLESDKNKIVQEWMNNSVITEIFILHHISVKRFTLNYAPKIVTYFIDVIKGTKELGDCPIMSKFVKYMLLKNITPSEVYDICTRFRKVLSQNILENPATECEKYIEMLNEFSTIFDANFSGVLILFNDFLEKQSKTIEKSLEYKKKFQNMSSIIDVLGVKVFIVQSGEIILGNRLFFQTLGVNDLEDLYNKYSDGFSFLKNITFKIELFKKEKYSNWIEALINEDNITATIFNPNSRKETSYTLLVETLPQSDPTQYIFTLRESLVFNEIEKENLISKTDELTGLYSYAVFKSYFSEMKEAYPKEKLALVVIEASGVSKINEKLGFEKGDRHLIEIASIIKNSDNSLENTARLSGNKFAIILHFDTKQKSYDWAVHLRYKLEKISDSINIALVYYEHENSNMTELHAYELLHNAHSNQKKHVICNSKDINQYDLLEDQNMFISQFKKIKEINEGAVLFKEIVVRSKNKILAITDKSVYMELSSKQLLVAQVNQSFYMQCKLMGYMSAVIVSINHKKSTAELQRFTFCEHTPLKRKMVHVVPNETFELELIDEELLLENKIIYLNEEYISLSLPRKKSLTKGKLIYMDVTLDNKYIEIQGSIFILEKTDEGYNCIIHFHHTTKTKSKICNYIARRQMGTIRELNSL